MQKLAFLLLLLLLISLLAMAAGAESRVFWDPTAHGITPELKLEFDEALAKGDEKRADQIRQLVAQQILNAFWAGANVRTLRPIMEEWNIDFKGRK